MQTSRVECRRFNQKKSFSPENSSLRYMMRLVCSPRYDKCRCTRRWLPAIDEELKSQRKSSVTLCPGEDWMRRFFLTIRRINAVWYVPVIYPNRDDRGKKSGWRRIKTLFFVFFHRYISYTASTRITIAPRGKTPVLCPVSMRLQMQRIPWGQVPGCRLALLQRLHTLVG